MEIREQKEKSNIQQLLKETAEYYLESLTENNQLAQDAKELYLQKSEELKDQDVEQEIITKACLEHLKIEYKKTIARIKAFMEESYEESSNNIESMQEDILTAIVQATLNDFLKDNPRERKILELAATLNIAQQIIKENAENK